MIERTFTALTVFGFVASLYFFGWHTESHYLGRVHYLLLFLGIELGVALVCVGLAPLAALLAEKEPDPKKRDARVSNWILSFLGMAWINVVWLLPFANELGPESERRLCKVEVQGKRLEEIWCLASECYELLLPLEAGEEPRWLEPPFWQVWRKYEVGDPIPVVLAKGYLGLEYVDLSPQEVSPEALDLCLP